MTFLYTVVPPEEIWDDDHPGAAAPPSLVEVTYRGILLLVRRTPSGAVIERLLTTDPNAYLEPGLSPGTLLAGVVAEK
ncbi:MAG: YlzJ-like family protein [Bacillota bacterium]|nr:YlzJ-like family protein [Bacillota bacterium]